MRWTNADLAEAMAKNPQLRLSRPTMRLQPTREGEVMDAYVGMPEALKASPTPRKYRNEPIVVDGIRFDSKKEAARWQELKLMERAGEISELRRQVQIRLDVGGGHICTYVADFQYQEKLTDGTWNTDATWRNVVEDVKSQATRKLPAYRIKKKLVKALFGIEIRET